MWQKAWHFIKYNNAVILIVALVLIGGTGVLASETGQELIGGKTIRKEGVDNTLLLEADLPNLPMDFRITTVESDQDNFYVKYTYIDLVKMETAWEYQMLEKELRLAKSNDQDLGGRIIEELSEIREARLSKLADEKEKALAGGIVKRVELVEYSGLVGKTLDLAGKVIPGYEPIQQREISSPVAPVGLRNLRGRDEGGEPVEASPVPSDSMSEVYDNYARENDPDSDNVFGVLDNCPELANPLQEDADNDGAGDACANDQGAVSGELGVEKGIGDEESGENSDPVISDQGAGSGELETREQEIGETAEEAEPTVEIVEPVQ